MALAERRGHEHADVLALQLNFGIAKQGCNTLHRLNLEVRLLNMLRVSG
jgi:hypothetical protein